MVKPLTDDFDGNAGDLDKRALANMMRLVGLCGDPIGVSAGLISIEHRGDRMVATLTVTLTSGGHVFPDQLGVYQIESAPRGARTTVNGAATRRTGSSRYLIDTALKQYYAAYLTRGSRK